MDVILIDNKIIIIVVIVVAVVLVGVGYVLLWSNANIFTLG